MPELSSMARALGLQIEENRSGCYRVLDEHGVQLHSRPWLSPFYASQVIRIHRAKIYRPVYVVAHGWIMFKDACAAAGHNWRECVHVTQPGDLLGCKYGTVIIDRSFNEAQGPQYEAIKRELEKHGKL